MTTLCVVLYSGGTDCSFSFVEMAPNDLEDQWWKGSDIPPPVTGMGGFVNYSSKTMYLNENDHSIDHVLHEIKHVVCYLEWEKSGVEHPNCTGHFRLFT